MTQRVKEVALSDYKIFETEQFQKDIKKYKDPLINKRYNKIIKKVYPQLRDNPFYGNNIKKLKDWKPETWRYRVDNFRIFYEVNENEKIVFIISYENRKEAY